MSAGKIIGQLLKWLLITAICGTIIYILVSLFKLLKEKIKGS